MALAIVSMSMSAQGLKGTWFAGGEFSYSSNKGDDGIRNLNTMVLPIAGTFVSPSVAVGAGIGYIGGKKKDGGEQIGKLNQFVFKPLVRKYWNISGGLFFYGQAALPLIFGSGEATSGEGKYNVTNIGLELSPGFDYVINSWLTIETSFTIFSAGLNKVKPKGGDASTNWNIGAAPFNSIDDRKVGDLQVGVKFLF